MKDKKKYKTQKKHTMTTQKEIPSSITLLYNK
jgi:hypothetical protein